MSELVNPEPVVLYGYDQSPYYNKIKNLLAMKGIKHYIVEQPMTAPRPDLLALNIEYRRTPTLVIGRDVYLDSNLISHVVCKKWREPDFGVAEFGPSILAFESLSNNLFWTFIAAADFSKSPESFKEDRRTLWPKFASKESSAQRPHNLSQLGYHIHNIENVLQDGRKWMLGGDQPTLADLYIGFVLHFILFVLRTNTQEGFKRESLRNVHEFTTRYNHYIKSLSPTLTKINGQSAKDLIESSNTEYAPTQHDTTDGTKINVGDQVEIVPSDQRAVNLQRGILVALNAREIVLDVGNRLRVHAPRLGFKLMKVELKSNL
ncbi:glutathione S-transferase [Acrasis kona]|uniref:Glutathione S-transferase n=1 Tax=Acrasis kona TaxID=1008807 RepID=A0AAW2ZPW6_9EUKA